MDKFKYWRYIQHRSLVYPIWPERERAWTSSQSAATAAVERSLLRRAATFHQLFHFLYK